MRAPLASQLRHRVRVVGQVDRVDAAGDAAAGFDHRRIDDVVDEDRAGSASPMPPVNFAGGLRSSPVCGFSACTMPVLDTAYTLLPAPRPPPSPPPPPPPPRPCGAAGAAPAGRGRGRGRRASRAGRNAGRCAAGRWWRARRARRRRAWRCRGGAVRVRRRVRRGRAAGGANGGRARHRRSIRRRTPAARPAFAALLKPRLPEHAIEVVVDRVDRVRRRRETPAP